jgi:PAS domain S-box-containing protein
VSVRRDGTIVAWSAGAEQVFGWSPEQALGRRLDDLVIGERFRDLQGSAFRRLLVTGDRRSVGRCLEIAAIRRDGRELPVELTITTIQSAGAPIFEVTLEDISARRGAELELRRLAAIVSTSSDAILSGHRGRDHPELERRRRTPVRPHGPGDDRPLSGDSATER